MDRTLTTNLFDANIDDHRVRSVGRSNAVRPNIPLCRTARFGSELEFIGQVLASGHLCGDGLFTEKCNRILEREIGCARALLTTSCTHALEMAALLLEVEPGDEIILPSFTFVSSASAFTGRGATPVFVDIRGDTLNLDESLIKQRITRRTKAIVVVHYGGVACQMDAIMDIADRYDIAVIEDNAHSLFGYYGGRPLGSIGAMSTCSFHETKNYSCGEGGALLINDPKYRDRAEIIREKGTNRHQFLRGQVDRYTWCDQGSSYLPSEILAAQLYAQLSYRQQIQDSRSRLHESYLSQLSFWASEHGVQLMSIPHDCDSAYHLLWMLMPSAESQTRLIAHLQNEQISAAFHYQPLHSSTMGAKLGCNDVDLPVTDRAATHLVRLPFFTQMTDREVSRVISAIKSFDDWL